jgi:transcriptional regulator with XRE-family HTH domain
MRKAIARVESPGGGARGHFDAEAFFVALDATRRARDLNWKELASAAGVSASTLTRMGQGKRPDVDSLAALAAWSGLRVDDFVRVSERQTPEPLAAISTYLRSDASLSAASAAALEEIIRAAYSQLRSR